MTIGELFSKQQELDDYILAELQNRTWNKVRHIDLINEECVAVFVELGEFMEEQDRNKKLIEYVDILHFLLSIGNAFEIRLGDNDEFETNYNTSKNEELNYGQLLLPEMFYEKLSKFINYSAEFKYWKTNKIVDKKEQLNLYLDVFICFMYVGNAFEYTADEVLNAYMDKHKENQDRQKNNY